MELFVPCSSFYNWTNYNVALKTHQGVVDVKLVVDDADVADDAAETSAVGRRFFPETEADRDADALL